MYIKLNKERQADVGFGSSLTQLHNKICLTAMIWKLSDGITGNEQGFAFVVEFEKLSARYFS